MPLGSGKGRGMILHNKLGQFVFSWRLYIFDSSSLGTALAA